MLHVANGESLMNRMKETPLPGSVIPWREATLSGPAPGGLDDAGWIGVRAHHLFEAYGIPETECAYNLRFQNEAFDAGLLQEEITLWFEEDLHCMVHLLYILDRIGRHEMPLAQPTLVRPRALAGLDPMYGLGHADAEQLMQLFELRTPITPAVIERGRRAWKAYTSPDPVKVVEDISTDTGEIAGLAEAFRLHLTRFPESRTGLTLVHRAALEALANGPMVFPELFKASKPAIHGIGLGDWQFWNEVHGIVNVERPLLAITGLPENEHPLLSGAWKNATATITDAGRDALAGVFDNIAVNGIDLWLGGVHVFGRQIAWRWDRESRSLQHSERLVRGVHEQS